MALSSDPYEQKLYNMFQSHGTGDGSIGLDREALLKLCQTLELKERGHLLVKCLLIDAKKRVNFREFREGLLHILGGEEDSLPTNGGDNYGRAVSFTKSHRGSCRAIIDSDSQQQQHLGQQLAAGPTSVCLASVGKSKQVEASGTVSSNLCENSSTSGFFPTSTSPSYLAATGCKEFDDGKHHRNEEGVNEAEQEEKLPRHGNNLLFSDKTKQNYDHYHKTIAHNDERDDISLMDDNVSCHSKPTYQPPKQLQSSGDDVDESSDREVSPKFVVGSKKYGRRSRPRADVNGFDTSSLSSNSDNESVAALRAANAVNAAQTIPGPASSNVIIGTAICSGIKVQRSASQSDIHGSKRRRPLIGSGAIRLKRCASLPSHRQRPTTTPIVMGKRQSAQLQIDNDLIDQKIYFMNLSENLRDIWNSLLTDGDPGRRHGDMLNQAQLEQVCEQVGLQKTPARLAAKEVFSKLSLQPIEGITFDEFIALLESNTDLLPMPNDPRELGDCGDCSTLLSSASVGPAPDDSFTLAMPDWTSEIGSLTTSIIIDMWESAGIAAPAALLSELGFDAEIIQVADLVLALEEEHQRLVGGHLNSSSISSSSNNVNDATQIVRASLALHKAEVNALRQAFHQLVDENKKLYADNKEVNHRALLLAQEVDERHNSLENSTRTKIRHLEQRHHETVKEMSSQLAFEREQLSHANATLEKRVALLEGDESKLKVEMSRLSEENEELRLEQENLTMEITDLLEKNIKLNRDIAELEENNRNDYSDEDECGFVRKDSEEVLDLIDRISLLQGENTGLRDKNDELSAEIEMLNTELSKFKLKRSPFVDDSCGSVGDGVASSTAVKRRGDSPSKTRLSDESPRLGKFRKCSLDNDNESDSFSGDWMALHSELGQSIRAGEVSPAVPICCAETGTSSGISSMNESSLNRDDEIKALRNRIEELELELDAKKQAITDQSISTSVVEGNETATPAATAIAVKQQECEKLNARCEELESSLEQMRKEYEDCEDYWQAKVNDERLLYEEEQRISDDKFSDLLKKVAEYEEQFSGNSRLEKNGRLSPIDEKDGLEQQYVELEADFDHAQLALEEKSREVEKLLQKIQEMEQMNKYPSDTLLSPSPRMPTPERADRPASSPISYLWNQSTIQRPVRDYQNPNWQPSPIMCNTVSDLNITGEHKTRTTAKVTSEQVNIPDDGNSLLVSSDKDDKSFVKLISPIQKPINMNGNSETTGAKEAHHPEKEKAITIINCVRQLSDGALEPQDVSDTSSVKSVRSSQSLASTNSILNSIGNSEDIGTRSVAISAEQVTHMRLVQLQLQDEIKHLTHERDCLLMELQQLKEAKPILARVNTKTATHPNQMQKIQHLEQKNRHLQSMLKQQQQYTESILHQIWQQQRSEINELRNRLEAQCILISDQATQLASNDILVKDMYEENSRLMVQVKRLEHQCLRATWLQQINQSNSSSSSSSNHHSQGLSGIMPGLPYSVASLTDEH